MDTQKAEPDPGSSDSSDIQPIHSISQAAVRTNSRRNSLWQGAAVSKTEVNALTSPSEVYQQLVTRGVLNSKLSFLKTLHAAIMGGFQVGIGGLLCQSVCGNIPDIAAKNPAFVKLIFGSLFPCCLMMILNTGSQLYTGNTATMAAAFVEGKIRLRDVFKSWITAFLGNGVGATLAALISAYTGMLQVPGTAAMAKTMGTAKVAGGSFGQMLVKGIMANYLVCVAVFQGTQARDMMGRYIGIFIPISTFVTIGFEHSVANLYLFPAAMLAKADISLKDVVVKNLIPVTIGNAIAGAGLIGASFSFAFGKLGEGR